MNTNTPPEIAETEYELWRELIAKRCGLFFNESQLRYLTQRLWERMQLRGMTGYRDYYNFVLFNPNGEGEWRELLELIVINETSFFRHLPSYAALANIVLPQVMLDKRKYGRTDLSLWSSGCSAGQEAYSLAIVGLQKLDSPAWQLRVSGTDISDRILDKARAGIYRHFEVRHLPDPYRNGYLIECEDPRGTYYRVADRVRECVRFESANLMFEETIRIVAQDVIFCQNVLLYFKPERRHEVAGRLCQRLNPGGYLFLAPAEVVGFKMPGIRQVPADDALIYQKC